MQFFELQAELAGFVSFFSGISFFFSLKECLTNCGTETWVSGKHFLENELLVITR